MIETDNFNKINVYTLDGLICCIKCAINDFKENDIELLELNVDEWAITHQIACYLKKYFPDWHVDCEYNRKGKEIKRSQNRDNRPIRPDIIIHQRGFSKNLLVIEVKKSDNNISEDIKKLKELTRSDGEYKYIFGLLLIISVENPGSMKADWFQDGAVINCKVWNNNEQYY